MDALAVVGAILVGLFSACSVEILAGGRTNLPVSLISGLSGAMLGAAVAGSLRLGLSGFWTSFALSAIFSLIFLGVGALATRRRARR